MELDKKFIKQRSKYLMQIRSKFETALYEERQLKKNEHIQDLITKNTILLGNVTPTFMYKGEMYCAWYSNISKGCNRIIHPTMLDEVSKVINEIDFELIEAETKVMNYIGNALIAAQNIDDLIRMIPERMHRVINDIFWDIFNISEPMTELQITQFKEQNRAGLIAFKSLFLERLLLA